MVGYARVAMVTHDPELHRPPSSITLGIDTNLARDAIDQLQRSQHAGRSRPAEVRRLVTRGERGEDESWTFLLDSAHQHARQLVLERGPALDVSHHVRMNDARRIQEAAIELVSWRESSRDHRLHA